MANVGLGAFAMRPKTILTNHLDYIHWNPVKHGEYNELSTGRIQVFIDLWSRVFT